MGKLDALEQAIGAHVDDSLIPQPRPGGGKAQPTAQNSGPGLPAKLRGLTRAQDVSNIPITKLVADPDQPREIFEEDGLQLLANSIARHGVLQPLVVRWSEEHSYYILIAGERRWRAAQIAGLQSIPCTIIDKVLDPGQILTLQLIENLNRADIKPLEAARGYRRLMELQSWSAGQLAEELHLPKSTVARTLELLDLPEPVRAHVESGTIAPSVAAEVGRLESRDDQVALAEQVVKEKLTRDAVVAAVRERKAGAGHQSVAPQHVYPGTHVPATKPPRPVIFQIEGGIAVHVIARQPLSGQEALSALERAVEQAKAALGSAE